MNCGYKRKAKDHFMGNQRAVTWNHHGTESQSRGISV